MAFVEIDTAVLQFLNGHLGRNDEDAYRRCSQFAYRDMCRTIPFVGDYKEEKSKSAMENRECAERKQKKRMEVTQMLREQIEEWIANPPVDQTEFNEVHSVLCNRIIDLYENTTAQDNPNHSLFFGQAQKWVNMTLKNLYVYSMSNPSATLSLAALVPFLHVPLDSIIIDIAADAKHCYVDPSDLKYEVIKPDVAWSKLSEAQYKDYQTRLTTSIRTHSGEDTPILWELTHWSTVES
jgi:hypothetical protein